MQSLEPDWDLDSDMEIRMSEFESRLHEVPAIATPHCTASIILTATVALSILQHRDPVDERRTAVAGNGVL